MNNAPITGTLIANLSDVLDALRSRRAEINICGLPCPGTCQTCVESMAHLDVFYAPEAAPAQPKELPTTPIEEQEEWEERARAARARDEAEESARTGMWADGLADIEHRSLAEDDEEDDRSSYSSYDDRQDYYDEDDGGYDGGWNESGYFDY